MVIATTATLLAALLGGIEGSDGANPPKVKRRPGSEAATAAPRSTKDQAPKGSAATDRPDNGRPQGQEQSGDAPRDGNVSPLKVIESDRWTGDFDGMAKRHVIRALVAYSKTFFFLDGGRPRGLSYDGLKMFETFVNKKLKKGHVQVRMVFMPVSRDQLLPSLVEGLGDLAAANLTITPERQKTVDFSRPFLDKVKEIVVTGPGAPKLGSLDDLAGKEIYVRKSSSYYESLRQLDAKLRKAGKPAMKLRLADENLEDEDLLEMMNAGLIKIAIVDDHKAEFWAKIFDGITLHPNVAVRTGGKIAWAFRKNSSKLQKVVNEFVQKHRAGTKFGNIVLRRYLKDTKWVRNATSSAEMKKFRAIVPLFRKYSDKYSFDWLMIAAQAYQESRFNQKMRSRAGAVGVMQIKPSTAAGDPINIRDVERLENNVHAGVKYLRFIADRYYEKEDMDNINKGLFSFASYNAGPARVAGLRRKAAARGLNPNVWFKNVERVAAREIGRETVQYVSNIYKYYIAYRLVVEQEGLKEKAIMSGKPAG